MEKNGNSPSVLVIMAALNEERGIALSLSELKVVLEDSKCLVVDGNSVDRTVEFAKELGADVLFQTGSGKGGAIAQALSYVTSDVHYVVFTDADYTYPAKCLPEMIRILEAHPNVGMVTGNRFNQSLKSGAMKNSFFIGNRILAFSHRVLNGLVLHDPLTGLRIVRWELLKNWKPKSKGFDIEVEMNMFIEKTGYKIVELPIQYRIRVGQKKLRLKDGFTILKRIIADSLF
jgi:dolichol-phosphate mannosyltransferase